MAKVAKRVDLIGQVFGRLTVIRVYDRRHRAGQTVIRWLCRCECGVERLVLTGSLRTGNTNSCGCQRVDSVRASVVTHDRSRTPEYAIWKMIVQRTTNPKNKNYAAYGGRGIGLCDRWRAFEGFLSDMGDRPSPDLSVERIDNNAGYSPHNCKWGTRTEQALNTRPKKTNTSGVVGVTWHKATGKWRAQININNKKVGLGVFTDIGLAAAAYQSAHERRSKV